MSQPVSDRDAAIRDDAIRDDAIAVIGMAVRVPGAADVEEFWENLLHGRESVIELDEQTLLANGVRPERLADDNYVRAAAPVADVEYFDADFFGLTPRDAAATDPQIKLFLEVAHAAIENAGYDPVTTEQSIGVLASVGPSRYGTLHLNEDAELAGGAGLGLHTLNNSDYLATTASYRLNLRGPSVTVLTACSSSLVALHLACQSLRAGDCDAVIVGGADVEFPVGHGYLWTPGSILSRDGHCRPFDAAANGTIFGSGAVAVLLKPLAEALADGDRISAVVLGSAVNNDGADKVSFGAPSLTGQASVVMEAMQLAGVAPAEIDYVEMHGTGTPLGDPIEVSALTEAYAALSDRPLAPGSCGIGSVKGNVGHLGPVAGIIGLVKTVLALEREQLPPTINLSTVNPRLELAGGPFQPVRQLRPWPAAGRVRRAGVSSLGIGGSNAHVVLAGSPEAELPYVPAGPQLLVWSARDPVACRQLAQRLSAWFIRYGELEFADGAATLQHGRTAHAVRRAVVAAGALDAAAAVLDDTRLIGPDSEQPITVPGLAEVADSAFRVLAGRLPAFEAALETVLRSAAEQAADASAQEAVAEWAGGQRFGPLLAVAVRMALVRTWLDLGLDATVLRAPADLPELLAAVDRAAIPTAAGLDRPAAAAEFDQPAAAAAGLDRPAAAGVGPAGDPDALWRLHLSVLGRIWTSGEELDWAAAGCPAPRRRAALPGYPYQRSRHWVPFRGTAPGGTAQAGQAGTSAEPAGAWYPVWQQSAIPGPARPGERGVAVLLAPPASRTALLALRQLGYDVLRYPPAGEDDQLSGPPTPDQLDRVLSSWAAAGHAPTLLVDALGFTRAEQRDPGPGGSAPAATHWPPSTAVRLLLTSQAADVSGCEPVDPDRARLAWHTLSSGLADRWLDAPVGTAPDQLAAALDSVLADEPDASGSVLAVRGKRRWQPAAIGLPAEADGSNEAARALDRRTGVLLVVDADGSTALELAHAVAGAGVAAALRVVTAAGSPTAHALLDIEDYGPSLQLTDWDGKSGSAAEAVARAVANARLAAVVVVSAAPDADLVGAVAAGLPAPPAAVAALVVPAAAVTVPIAAAAAAASPVGRLGADRQITLLGTANGSSGRLLLDLLTGPAPELVVGAG